MILNISILILLLILSGFFSASETALVSLSPAKVRDLVQKKAHGSKLVEKLKSDPHQLLITILIGNNFVNIGASVFATLVFEELLGSSALGVITGVLTLVILIFGEIVPKSFAQANAKGFSLSFAPLLYAFSLLFLPLVWILDFLVNKLLHLAKNGADPVQVTEDELKAFVSIGAEEGAIERDEQELIENVLEFSDTRVEEIMIPRVEIKAISENSTIREVADFIIENHHSRIPVFRDNIDNIISVITVKDMIQYMHAGNFDVTLNKLKLLKPPKVPRSKKINALFNEFQKRRTHLGIVLDEHGGTVGLITLEDILEEIVGEIVDEFDQEEKEELTKIGKMEVEATGKALIEHINEALKIQISAPEHKTISYYIAEKLGRFPRRGETIEEKGFRITVDEMDKHTILKVSIEKTNG